MKMEKTLEKMEKVEKMEKILAILEKIIVTIPIHLRTLKNCPSLRSIYMNVNVLLGTMIHS